MTGINQDSMGRNGTQYSLTAYWAEGPQDKQPERPDAEETQAGTRFDRAEEGLAAGKKLQHLEW